MTTETAEPAPMCPGGCGCRLGTGDADRFECGCDGGCCGEGRPEAVTGAAPLVLPADELAAVRHLAAAARAADAAYQLAAARVVLYEFLHQYGRSVSPAFKVALDLASSLRKIIDDLAENDAAGSALDDTGRHLPAAPGQARDRTGADPREPGYSRADLEYAPADPEHEALAASLPGEWVKAAESRYSMHGSGLVRNLLAGAVPLIRAAERERLGVIPLSEALTDEEVAGFRERFEAAMADPGPLRVLPSDDWRERAEAAEAKLAAIIVKCNIATALARASHGMRHPYRLGDKVAASVDVGEILAITGTGEEAGNGQ